MFAPRSAAGYGSFHTSPQPATAAAMKKGASNRMAAPSVADAARRVSANAWI